MRKKRRENPADRYGRYNMAVVFWLTADAKILKSAQCPRQTDSYSDVCRRGAVNDRIVWKANSLSWITDSKCFELIETFCFFLVSLPFFRLSNYSKFISLSLNFEAFYSLITLSLFLSSISICFHILSLLSLISYHQFVHVFLFNSSF